MCVTGTKMSSKHDHYRRLEELGVERRSEKEEEVDPSQLSGATGRWRVDRQLSREPSK